MTMWESNHSSKNGIVSTMTPSGIISGKLKSSGGDEGGTCNRKTGSSLSQGDGSNHGNSKPLGGFPIASVTVSDKIVNNDDDDDDDDDDDLLAQPQSVLRLQQSLSTREMNNPVVVSSAFPTLDMLPNNNTDDVMYDDSMDPSESDSFHDSSQRSYVPKNKLRLGHRETQMLCLLRGMTMIIFLLSATLLGIAIHFATIANQQEQFAAVYNEQANQIMQVLQTNLMNVVLSLDQLAIQYQSMTSTTTLGGGLFFSENTLPNYQVRAKSILGLAHGNSYWMGMAPYIQNKTQWAVTSQFLAPTWIPETSNSKDDVSNTIYPQSPTTSNENYYYPIWQNYPTNIPLINLNLLQVPQVRDEVRYATMGYNNDDNAENHNTNGSSDPPSIVLGQFYSNIDLLYNPNDTDNNKSNSSGMVSSPMFFPILQQKDNTMVTGVVWESMDWSKLLAPTSMDSSANGIICIVSDQCSGNYAFQVVVVVTEDDNNENDNNNENKNGQRQYGKVIMEPLQELPTANTLLLELEQVLNVSQFLYDATTISSLSFLATNISFNNQYCPYSVQLFPSYQMRNDQMTNEAAIYTGTIVGVFLFCVVIFVAYDNLVERRQNVVMNAAAKTHEIVDGLFPEVVRNRLFGDINNKKGKLEEGEISEFLATGKLPNSKNHNDGRPIADLFPNTTVLFADIAGFTAWSSVRDPSQVFTLLETIYAAFDKIALRRQVFKVETIGDCYVAVTGLPTPQGDHAVRMVKFARDCLRTMQTLGQSLEVDLGPDTGDLAMRIGLHSGPVTAGVLRGQKSRFQLFGDTVNTASRMESNGLPHQIQCSQQTADLLVEAGKGRWIHPRKDMVHAKGKGFVQTYWVIASRALSSSGSSVCSSNNDDGSIMTADAMDKMAEMALMAPPVLKRARSDVSPHLQRLIDWTVDLLAQNIKTILAARIRRRNSLLVGGSRGGDSTDDEDGDEKSGVFQLIPKLRGRKDRQQQQQQQRATTDSSFFFSRSQASQVESTASELDIEEKNNNSIAVPTLLISSNPRDEYCEAIKLPQYDPLKPLKRASNLKEEDLDRTVKYQLNEYVTTIACAYNNRNPFHNFEHASHVTMSANKILKRVVSADHVKVRRDSVNLASKLHHFTFGITSDPLTHFACLFSALIHDVDHPGVSNAQLLKEKHDLSEVYDGKSIAEQNSFDFAWELLMDSDFAELRAALFENEEDLRRFRQLVINSIMATDVFDPDLVKLRNERWKKAFPPDDEKSASGEKNGEDNTAQEDTMDLKATIVIEHIIQAADVAHTMQHWHVYQKWNRRLFEEMYAAYKSGRSSADPSKSWYRGELWFYDNYIIPLAKKLKECQVFGASSDEFLTYANDNRSEWETKGQRIVVEMMENCTEQSEEFMLRRMSQADKSDMEKTVAKAMEK